MDYLLAENLSCIRGSNTVFKNLSFKVSRGQILHITGANGSGKTSLLRMIAGFIYPSEGKIIPEKNYTHKDVHFVGQKYALKKNLSVEKNLSLWSYLYQKKINTDQILSDLDLTQYKDNDIEVLSDGQKRRLSIARLFIYSAPIWLLDEVHVHLDSEWQVKLDHYIYNYINEGGIVLISSNTKIELNSNIEINLTNYNV